MEGTIAEDQESTIRQKLEILFAPTGRTSLCPVRDILDRVGDKWSILAILFLGRHGTLRFNELKRNIDGVSQRMLTVTLRSLERDGLLTRRVYPEVPPRVEYGLTPLGRSLLEQVLGLAGWANGQMEAIVAARSRYDGQNA
ncbi:MAG: helix-turn-helix transcriptional regulator [Cytophagales bacterium]|nr:helix-turn-helix transcriptional regulator [Cytophagales bacterium]